jgi:hypothetical protein
MDRDNASTRRKQMQKMTMPEFVAARFGDQAPPRPYLTTARKILEEAREACAKGPSTPESLAVAIGQHAMKVRNGKVGKGRYSRKLLTPDEGMVTRIQNLLRTEKEYLGLVKLLGKVGIDANKLRELAD